MKRENYVKKVLLKSLPGFIAGGTLLMLSYAGTYFLGGEEVFIKEIDNLKNVTSLIMQVLGMGIVYYSFLVALNNTLIGQETEKEYRKQSKFPYKTFIIGAIIDILAVAVSFILLSSTRIYSENICVLNIMVYMTVFAFSMIIVVIKGFNENKVIKKINQKIKERNKKEL